MNPLSGHLKKLPGFSKRNGLKFTVSYVPKFDIRKLFIQVLFLCLILTSGGAAKTTNPHHELPCTRCHPKKPQADIPRQEKKTIANLGGMTPCIKCHEQESNLHPLGVKPPESNLLPSVGDQEGITCLTCHFIHAETNEYSLLRGFAEGKYKYLWDMCFQCHKEGFYRKNPHRTSESKNRCSFCHMSTPRGKTPSQIKRFCDFCHSKQVHKTTRDYLQKDCFECHVSHGTADAVYHLRKDFVLAQPPEVDPHKNNVFCHKCHKNQPGKEKPVNFLYGGNFTVLCTSCHWSKNFMHPVEVTIPPRLQMPETLPLSAEKKITCNTCHDSCAEHQVKKPGLIRRQPEYKSRNDMCFECHKRKRYAKTNPHNEQYNTEKCIYCHDHDVRLSYRTLGKKKVLKATEYLLCLRCHAVRNPPKFNSHIFHRKLLRQGWWFPRDFRWMMKANLPAVPATILISGKGIKHLYGAIFP
jgi:hypothetical protein